MAPERPLVVVVTGRHRPHELLLLAASVLFGVAGLLAGAPAPNSVAALLPGWAIHVWTAMFLLSGGIGIPACLWRGNLERAMTVEAGAMLVGAGALGSYCIAVAAVAPQRGLFSLLFFGGWAVANVVRAVQIARDLKQIRRGRHGVP